MMKKNKINKLICFCTLVFTLFLLGCSTDGDADNDSQDSNNPTPGVTIMTISKNNLSFGYLENTHSFLIRNLSDTPFDWNWTETSSSSVISASPNSGTLAAGASIEVTLTLDRSNMVTQIYNLAARISNNKGQSFSQLVEIRNYTEDKWFIGGNVIDAEYDRVNDVMIVVSENPNQIRKFNLATNVEESLSLDNMPKCISISQDGNYAAVGHNGSFSYINLTSMTIENNYAVSTDVYDIVLAPNNWVYITSSISYQKMRCVNLSDGQETFSQYNQIGSVPSYPNSAKAKLHPSGNYIYATPHGIVPSDIDKYSITNGTAQFLYDSQYHGDYEFGNKFWLSENGSRIFTNSKNIFSSSSTQNNDLIYLSSIQGLEGDDSKVIDIMDINTNSNRICALFVYNPDSFVYIPSNKVRVYNAQFSLLREVEIPKHMTTNTNGGVDFHESRGYFGFFNSSGTKFFVLVKYLPNQWAIATINVT